MKILKVTDFDFETIKNLIIENMDIETYVDEIIDETEQDICICGIKMYPSTVLKQYDPIAYNMVVDEEIDYLVNDIVARLEDGEKIELENITLINAVNVATETVNG